MGGGIKLESVYNEQIGVERQIKELKRYKQNLERELSVIVAVICETLMIIGFEELNIIVTLSRNFVTVNGILQNENKESFIKKALEIASLSQWKKLKYLLK